MENSKHIQPENPEEFTGLKLTPLPESAAGMTAVWSSLRHMLREMDPARAWSALRSVNQKDGFDCPGCAWPDPEHRSRLGEFCENGAKAIAEEATEHVLMEEFFRTNAVSELSKLSDFEIGKKGRLGVPVYLRENADHYEPVTWDNAFEIISGHLKKLDSPDEAIFYTSGRTSNEAAFMYQLFVREFGTNNLPDCSNLCHESSGVALNETLGTGKGTVTLEDFNSAELIIVIGQNPGTNHPRMLTALQHAKQHGAKIISINPLRETGLVRFANPQTIKGILGGATPLSDLHLPVKINGDMALIQGLCHLLLKESEWDPEIVDSGFIEKHTIGFTAYAAHLRGMSMERLCELSGITFEQVRSAVDMIKPAKRIITCWAMGLTQHQNAVNTIKEIVNLHLLKGSLGKPGAGVCPVRGHSNVQGDRTMGINERPTDGFLNNLDKVFGIKSPRQHGYDVVQSIHAMHAGKAKVMFALGGNFLSAAPDTLHTAEALQRCKLTVHVSTKLNRSHLVHGKEALILPCLGRSDRDERGGVHQFVTCENSMSVVHPSKGGLEPVSKNLLSEPEIVGRLAKVVLGEKSRVAWDKYIANYDAIREDIGRTIPGFDDYNQRVRHPGGFYLGNAARELRFSTTSAKAEFTVSLPTDHVLKEGELMMMTIRSHDQYNTTIYGLDDRYRGIRNERRAILMNEHDIAARKLKGGDVVDIHNHTGGKHRVARKFIVVPYEIPAGCVATYFPEANVLVPIDVVAEKSGTPASKTVVVEVVRSK